MLAGLLAAGCAAVAPPAVTPDANTGEMLCVSAQHALLGDDSVPVRLVRGDGSGFHTIQMDANPAGVTVAMSITALPVTGGTLPAWVACKMINRERAADVLGKALPAERAVGSCREINERTYAKALASLTEAERRRYLAQGRPLRFLPDEVLATGGEWLPADARDYLLNVPARGRSRGFVEVRAPAVAVPWDARQRQFYQGTRHCKLLTQGAMRRWMLGPAFDRDAPLLPPSTGDCDAREPDAGAGSCLFWFAPAGAMFCQDYTGAGWTGAAAREECGARHASAAALAAAGNRYAGEGGIYAVAACAERRDVPARAGTCVFQCGAADETRWRVPVNMPGDAGAGAMSRACDLYLPAR